MTLLVAWLEETPRLTRALLNEEGANAEMAEAPKIAATTAVDKAFMVAVSGQVCGLLSRERESWYQMKDVEWIFLAIFLAP